MPPFHFNYQEAKQVNMRRLQASIDKSKRQPEGFHKIKYDAALLGLDFVNAVDELHQLIPLNFEPKLTALLSDMNKMQMAVDDYLRLNPTLEGLIKASEQYCIALNNIEDMTQSLPDELNQEGITPVAKGIESIGFAFMAVISLLALMMGVAATVISVMAVPMLPVQFILLCLSFALLGLVGLIMSVYESNLNHRFARNIQFDRMQKFVDLVTPYQDTMYKEVCAWVSANRPEFFQDKSFRFFSSDRVEVLADEPANESALLVPESRGTAH